MKDEHVVALIAGLINNGDTMSRRVSIAIAYIEEAKWQLQQRQVTHDKCCGPDLDKTP